MVWKTVPTAKAASDFESDVLAATFAVSPERFMDAAPIACRDGWSTMRRRLSSRSRFGKQMRDRVPVRRRYTVMRTCMPSARVIRMSVDNVGLSSGASAL